MKIGRLLQERVVAPPLLEAPDTEAASFNEFLSRTTPGGPVVVQSLIVLMVYAALIFTCKPTPWGILLCALALMLTPWVPVIFGYGSTIAASIIFLNILAGAFSERSAGLPERLVTGGPRPIPGRGAKTLKPLEHPARKWFHETRSRFHQLPGSDTMAMAVTYQASSPQGVRARTVVFFMAT